MSSIDSIIEVPFLSSEMRALNRESCVNAPVQLVSKSIFIDVMREEPSVVEIPVSAANIPSKILGIMHLPVGIYDTESCRLIEPTAGEQ